MRPSTPRPRTGYVATGPGFYVWEETRRAAQQAARDLSPPSAGPPVVLPADKAKLRRPPAGRGSLQS